MIFTKHLKSFLCLTGAGTAAAFIYAIAPAWALTNLNGVTLDGSHQLLIQHWGAIVGLVGVMMIVAAYKPQWRESTLLLCTAEKAYLVFLFLFHQSNPLVGEFGLFALADSLMIVFVLGYWLEQHRKINTVQVSST
ncbi:hypothetical protein [Thalassotalea atypica]|uniref:hypothetical protein n=1 Tax=Thalassotalea atypica TaxID=2054316 RepID=UPI00257278E4|nr:hypothetical protein [Thalassotalea atypica]